MSADYLPPVRPCPPGDTRLVDSSPVSLMSYPMLPSWYRYQ